MPLRAVKDRAMHRRSFFRNLAAFASLGSWSGRNAVAAPAVIRRPPLLWSDEFVELSLSSPTRRGRWRPNEAWQDIATGYHDFAARSWNVNPSQTGFEAFSPFAVVEGILTLTNRIVPPTLESAIRSTMNDAGQMDLAVPGRMGGILITDPGMRSFLYGYFEFRVRFPNSGRGMFPAIWLFRDRANDDHDEKGRAEIDLFELFGEPKGQPYHITLHQKNDRGAGDTFQVSPPEGEYFGDAGEWHVLALDWQPDTLTFIRDGVILHRIQGDRAAWFNQSMSIRMNYAADATWFGQNRSDGSTPEILKMEIDYVRVFETRV
jgi:hypothetical protein